MALSILPDIILVIIAGGIGSWVCNPNLTQFKETGGLSALKIGIGFAFLIPIFNIILFMKKFNYISIIILFILTFIFRNYCIAFAYNILKRIINCNLIIDNKSKNIKNYIFFIPILMFSFGFVGLLAPSTGYDTNVYHLSLPKLYSNSDGYVPRPDILQSRYTQNLAGIRTFCFSFGGENSVEILNILVCALLLWLLLDTILILNLKLKWRSLCVILYCSSFQIIFYLYDADVEGWIAFYFLCFSVYIWNSASEKDFKKFIIIGALGGILIGIKLTALPAVVFICLWVLTLHRKEYKKNWGSLFIAGVLFIAISFFWEFIVFYMNSGFYQTEIIGKGVQVFSVDRINLSNLWLSTKSITIYNFTFIVYLILSPMSINEPVGKSIFIVTIFSMICIFVTNPWSNSFARYTFYLFPLIILGIIISFDRIDNMPSSFWIFLRRICFIFTVIYLVFVQGINIYRNVRKVPVAFGFQSIDDYLTSRVNTYSAIQFANNYLSSKDLLFMVGERNYWINVPFVLGINRNPIIDYKTMTSDSFLNLLDNLGATHVLFSNELTDYTSEFLAFWRKNPDIKNNQRLKLIFRNIWNGPNGKRNAYLYQLE